MTRKKLELVEPPEKPVIIINGRPLSEVLEDAWRILEQKPSEIGVWYRSLFVRKPRVWTDQEGHQFQWPVWLRATKDEIFLRLVEGAVWKRHGPRGALEDCPPHHLLPKLILASAELRKLQRLDDLNWPDLVRI